MTSLKTVNISIWPAAGGLPGQLAGSPVGELAALAARLAVPLPAYLAGGLNSCLACAGPCDGNAGFQYFNISTFQ